MSHFTHWQHARLYRKQQCHRLASWKLHSPAWTCLDSEEFSRLCHKSATWMVDISIWLCNAALCGAAGIRRRFLPSLWAIRFHWLVKLDYTGICWQQGNVARGIYLPSNPSRRQECFPCVSSAVPLPWLQGSLAALPLAQVFPWLCPNSPEFPFLFFLAELWTTTGRDS